MFDGIAAKPGVTRRSALRSLLAGLAAVGAGARGAGAAGPQESAAPRRVISVGGSLTEIVYALGAEEQLVAVDSTSTYPSSARSLPDVGYLRQLAAEPIIALRPDLVLADSNAGPPSVLDQLRAADIRLVSVPDTPSRSGVLRKIDAVAEALGMAREGAALARRFQADFDRLAGALSASNRRPKVLFLLSVGRGAPLAAGAGTSAAGIIELSGGVNAIAAFEGYKPLSPEASIAAAPEVLLVTERTLDLLGGREALLARAEVAPTPAARNGRLVALDALLLLGFGPRTPQAIHSLAEALHPGIQLPPLGE